MQKLGATGNTYDIQIEAKIIDDNQIRTSTTSNMSEAGEYKYYSVYTNIILDTLTEKDEYTLKKDDYITVTVKNTNITIGTQLKNFIYKLIGKETYTIGATSSALVLGNGDNNLYLGKIEAMEEPEPTPSPTPTPTPTPDPTPTPTPETETEVGNPHSATYCSDGYTEKTESVKCSGVYEYTGMRIGPGSYCNHTNHKNRLWWFDYECPVCGRKWPMLDCNYYGIPEPSSGGVHYNVVTFPGEYVECECSSHNLYGDHYYCTEHRLCWL